MMSELEFSAHGLLDFGFVKIGPLMSATMSATLSTSMSAIMSTISGLTGVGARDACTFKNQFDINICQPRWLFSNVSVLDAKTSHMIFPASILVQLQVAL